MLLAFDTSSAACTAALFDGGTCIAQRDELIGRGHSERLVPMIAELLDGRSASSILVGVGPGSFTGIRVAIAAAHGLAIGWGAELIGMSSLALLAAGTADEGEVAAAVIGGHGELFVQQFDRATAEPTSELRNLPPAEAARLATRCRDLGLEPVMMFATALPMMLMPCAEPSALASRFWKFETVAASPTV